jgi:hypothetical protein
MDRRRVSVARQMLMEIVPALRLTVHNVAVLKLAEIVLGRVELERGN